MSTPLQYDPVQITHDWDRIACRNHDNTTPTCPVTFSQEEAERIDALDVSHHDVDGDIECIRDYLGVGSDGWTTNERFESAKSRAAEVREEALASVEDEPWLREMFERHWPFDDCDEDE